MITYIVRSKRFQVDITPATLSKVTAIILERKLNPLKVLADIYVSAGALSPADEEIKGLLFKEEGGEEVYNDRSPIENRRAAFSYAEALYNTIEESGTHSDIIGYLQGVSRNVYGITISMRHNQEETLILFTHITPEILDNWTKELAIYEAEGYDTGGEPFTVYVPEAGKVVRVLGDMAGHFVV